MAGDRAEVLVRQFEHLPGIGLGDACRLFGLTARAVRFYEERGLIEARRDVLNRRVYDPPARRRLAWIAELRRARLSLPDIRTVLDAEDASGAGREAARARLQARRDRLQAEVAEIDGLIGSLGDGRAAFDRAALASAA
jgi:DNA-binding transcriptional MerR regulator